MKPTRRLVISVAAAIIVGAVAFFGARSLRPQDPPDFAFDYGAIAYDAPQSPAGVSKGGFTGFSSTGDQIGYTIVAGKAVDVSAQQLVLQMSNGAQTVVRLTGAPTVWVLTSANTTLKPGDKVLVRVAADGETAESVFLFSSS